MSYNTGSTLRKEGNNIWNPKFILYTTGLRLLLRSRIVAQTFLVHAIQG